MSTLPFALRRSESRSGGRRPGCASALAAAAFAGFAALAVLGSAGCALDPAPVAAPGEAVAALFDDAHVAPPAEPMHLDDVFRLTPEMEAYLRREVLPLARTLGARQALTEALYNRSGLQLEYESSMTRNAREAFEAREGNCLSLVIMTAAFAKALDLNVTYQQVAADDVWSRAGGMYFVSGHVNLTLQRRPAEILEFYDRYGLYTIDFMPTPGSTGLSAHPISENRVLAMYLNNRAAEAMVAGQLDDAYWRARDAVRTDPGFLSAYNTLGVVYQRRADVAHAEAVFRYVMAREPGNPSVLANEADALHGLGRTDEEQAVRRRLAVLEPHPPFYYFARGQAAYKAGDLLAARTLFKQELERDPDYHEFHFWLAITDFGLGRFDEARSEMSIALEDSVKRTDREIYAAKLDRLKAYQAVARPQ